jgi:hypothetical protein
MFDPETDVQPADPGPFAHPHQFWVALTAPVPRLSTPICLPRRLFRWASTTAGDTVFTATSTCSSLITLSAMTVPVIGATPKTLMPVGPGVAASSVSAPLPAM